MLFCQSSLHQWTQISARQTDEEASVRLTSETEDAVSSEAKYYLFVPRNKWISFLTESLAKSVPSP